MANVPHWQPQSPRHKPCTVKIDSGISKRLSRLLCIPRHLLHLYQHFGQQGDGLGGKFRFKMPLRLLDSTLISLTLSVYDWAHYTTTKGAVKLHTLLDYDGLFPEFVNITDGKCSDNKAAYDIPVNPNSIVVADRGYCDYSLLSHLDSNNVFFAIRQGDNIRYKTIRERPPA